MLKRRLTRFQRDFSKQRKTLEWHRNNLESSAEKIKEAIRHQYCNVKQWLFEAYQRQITKN